MGSGHADRPAAGGPQQRIATAPAGAFLPFDPAAVVEDEINLCLRWPDVPRVPAATPAPPYPTVPTLILQGAEDLRTPPAWSARVAARIPGAKRLVVPGVGHSTVSDPRGCAADAILRFVRGLGAERCSRVRTGVPAVAVGAGDFDSLPGYNGLPRKVGRTVRALAATFDDLRIVLSPAVLAAAGGGLRGGSWDMRAAGSSWTTIRRSAGVTVNGGGSRALTLRVSGTKAASGKVTLRSNGRLTGTLGGRNLGPPLRAARIERPRARVGALTRRPEPSARQVLPRRPSRVGRGRHRPRARARARGTSPPMVARIGFKAAARHRFWSKLPLAS